MFATQFENEEKGFRNRKTTIATVVTILVHGLILLLLILTILKTPLPPFADNAGGMSVNFGTDDVGTGNEQPFTYNPGETAPPTAAAKPEPVQSTPDKILTQDNAETDVTAPKADDKPKPKVNDAAVFKKPVKQPNHSNAVKSNPEPVVAPQPKPDANAMFSKGAFGKPNNSKGDGTGGGPGDQGKPNGDPNSKSYLGDGKGIGEGHGIGDLKGGYSLVGRKNISRVEPCACASQGTVVIAIKVDKTGKVIEATFKRFASTAVEDCNINCALIAARQYKFNPDAHAPEVQEGTITFINKVK